MAFREDSDIFSFAKNFKEYWSKHSKSISTPTFLIVGNDQKYSCIVVVDFDCDLVQIIKAFKIGANINYLAIGQENNF